MKSLLTRIGRKILRTRQIDGADVIRLIDYNARHPMWRVVADEHTVAAYDAIMKQAQRAA